MIRLLRASFTAGEHGRTEHRSSRNSSRAGRQSRGLGTGTSSSPANDSEERMMEEDDGTTGR
jgi:hypothetical protein